MIIIVIVVNVTNIAIAPGIMNHSIVLFLIHLVNIVLRKKPMISAMVIDTVNLVLFMTVSGMVVTAIHHPSLKVIVSLIMSVYYRSSEIVFTLSA